ncbi:MAG: prepilin-type N-terminal cleavage/methylation domain-containing protein [Azonexus sp.]|nr:prepilin-type N-terminal cleavage/methylation domain-containing protein [Azonexus sp.]
MKHQQRGFTLIEMAIVLIIVGLLLGGILKGQSLITQGKIRSTARDLDTIAVAMLSYQDRYQQLPGDDAATSSRWNLAAGDGDGKLEGAFNSSTDTDESRKLWRHLRQSGFISGAADSPAQPRNALGGITGLQTDVGNTGGTNATTELTGLVVCTDNLPGSIANALDTQFDDGLPNKGSVRAFDQAATDPLAGAAASAYTDDGAHRYILCRSV